MFPHSTASKPLEAGGLSIDPFDPDSQGQLRGGGGQSSRLSTDILRLGIKCLTFDVSSPELDGAFPGGWGRRRPRTSTKWGAGYLTSACGDFCGESLHRRIYQGVLSRKMKTNTFNSLTIPDKV
jgi:hypothetical protein